MDHCVPNHRVILSENYVVQPVESIPLSMIDYDRVEMTHFIHAEQLANGVIQLADVNSNTKTKALHPLEAEIQRDLELKQQSSSKCQASGIQTQEKNSDSSIFDGVIQVQTVNERENILNFNQLKPQDNICHFTPVSGAIALEKRQFILISDDSVVLNIDSKDEEISKQKQKPSEKIIENVKTESDSEAEDEPVQPVHDFEPDPEGATTKTPDETDKPNKCYMCLKSFRQKKNMYAHIRRIHSTQPKIEGGIMCPLCKMHALRQEHLRNHLELLHEIPIEKEEKLFSTIEEFLSWKEFIERETLSFYVSKSSSKLLANNQQKTYYKCHRSGNYVTVRKENRKKKLKVQGSNKIGATCPAAMEVTENMNGINVVFWKTHVGHDNDLKHLVLSKEDRAKIMDYVAAGVPWDKIIEIAKREGSKACNVPTRMTMVSKQDLRNIKKVYEMKTSPDLFLSRKKIVQGRKPVKEKVLRRASQSLVIEKADILLHLLKSTEVRPDFRPKICLMIDNLISTVKRRAVKSSKKEISQKKRQWIKQDFTEAEEKKFNDKSRIILNTTLEEPQCQEKMGTILNSEKNCLRHKNSKRTAKKRSTKEGSRKKIRS